MAKEPLTPSGVQQKTTDLYALSDPLLVTAADMIRADFKLWIKDNFLLNAAQETYLNNIDQKFIQLASCQTGFAVENRLPVSLSVVGNISEDIASKLIKTNSSLSCQYTPSSGTTASGSLSFEFIYPT